MRVCSMLIVFIVLLCLVFVFFFFFQAEDGIRDVAVTGVQTCALPILSLQASRLMAPICQRKCWFPHAPHTLCGKPPASRLQASRWAILTAKRHCVAWIYSPKQSGSRQESCLESIYNPAEIHLQYLPDAVLLAVIATRPQQAALQS